MLTGVLRIAGDAGADGDIALKLDPNETVVSIEANSKNLTLIKPLDKEASSLSLSTFRQSSSFNSRLMFENRV